MDAISEATRQIKIRESSQTHVFPPLLHSISISANGCNHLPRHIRRNASQDVQFGCRVGSGGGTGSFPRGPGLLFRVLHCKTSKVNIHVFSARPVDEFQPHVFTKQCLKGICLPVAVEFVSSNSTFDWQSFPLQTHDKSHII